MAGGTLAQGAPAAQSAAPIRLKAVTFTPAMGESPRMPLALTRRGPVAAGSQGYYLVQFVGPVQQEWKDQLTATGVEILDYIPDYAFKVRMTPELSSQVRQQPNVAYLGLWHPYYSVDPSLALGAGPKVLRVYVERGGDGAAVAGAVSAAGAAVVGVDNGAMLVVADGAQLQGFAQALDVAWVEPYVLNEKHDEYARTILGLPMNLGSPTPFPYDGSTQIAAVADTGIGGGMATTAHPDIPSNRIVGIFNWPGVTDVCFQSISDDGAIDVDSGHGTHVAGSVLSDGGASGEGLGLAPAARLVFQATENWATISSLCGGGSGYRLTGLNDLYGLYQQAYNAGARIHANSWGAAVAGDYNANSATTDDFIWDNKDFTITFSAGNSGADANADGVVDNDSIGAPATAKNVITIGASENDRLGNYQCDTGLTYTSRDTSYQNGQTCASMGGINLLGTPRQRWGFTANPIADDPTAGNANQMAAFSSRGPTDDGRIKPDVVAPGTWILSGYSGEFQEGYDPSPNPRNNAFQSDGWGIALNSTYKYFGGTSMSNPVAAGAATSVRDFYQKIYGIGASAALVKATVINSAVDMLDENNDGINDNDFPIPNVHEGWGRVNLLAATDGTALFADRATGLSTGGSVTYNVDVSSAGPLKVSLVWSDFASTASASINLVNNLDLTLTSPTGVVYRGNVFSGGWSAAGGSADARNNVENVYVQSAATGTWTITVNGFNVPQGPQPFALVVRGASSLAEFVPPAPVAPSNLAGTGVSRSQINLTWTDNATNETGFYVERCQGSTCTGFTRIATLGANTTSFSNTNLSRNTTYRYRMQAYNSGGVSAYSNIVTVSTLR